MKALLAGILLAICSPAHGAGLRAGAASVRITPPVGVPMAGYYSVRLSEGTHDDLHAKALVLDGGGAKAALVACDLISLAETVVAEARRLASEATGIPPERIMISATHSHTGPLMGSRFLAAAPPEARARAAEYLAALPARIAEAVRAANAALAPVRVSAAVGHEDSLAFNRRYFMNDGTVGWNPGKLNPRIVKPAGPTDPSVPVLLFEREDGSPLATYVNFAMHLDTTGGMQYSADYPFTLARLLGAVKGSGMVTLFSTGTCGNINHIDVRTRDRQQGPAEAARIGTILAGEVIKTYARLKPVGASSVGAANRHLALPTPPYTPDELARAREVAAHIAEKPAPPFLDQVKALRILDTAARDGKPLDAEVQVVTLGSQVAWVALPGEIFVELGQSIKERSPFPMTIIVELANGAIGYVPNKAAYPQDNYEVVSARSAEGSGEKLADTAVELLRSLRAR